jgi:predicted TIM-barrel fold metal-dependent hydrolase
VRHAYDLAEATAARDHDGFWAGRHGTAAGLIGVNQQFHSEFYAVPPEAVEDPEAADEALGGDEVVIDVQTHYVADRDQQTAQHLPTLYRNQMPSWWTGLDDHNSFSFAEYLRCVFLETENAVAVLSSSPGVEEHVQLYNSELYATRRLFEELGQRGRLLNHAVVDPAKPNSLESMDEWVEQFSPAAWKVYTLGEPNLDPAVWQGVLGWRDTMPGKWHKGWMLDDDGIGQRFMDRVEELARVGGPRIICAHKGISGLIDTGSPVDVGPAAAAHPGLSIVAYHSGYEITEDEEGAFTEETAHLGTNRLVKSLRDAGIATGSNVYAELGSTWFLATTRPREAAHVLGKLLLAVGEDNVLWGTDGIWYGATQQLIDAFRAFQIPLEMQEEFGYPALTPAIKDKILSRNAARLYGIDLAVARQNLENDDLAWLREAYRHYLATGSPS